MSIKNSRLRPLTKKQRIIFHSSLFIVHSSQGYVLLITIVVIGAIASAILASILMLGISANHVSLSIQQSTQAFSAAQACAEYGLLKLRQSPSYAGGENITIGANACEILTIGGIGNNNRMLCVEGQVGDAIRRLEIVVNQILPQTKIYSWQEVAVFSLCE